MMIDFLEIRNIIPSNGEAHLILRKTEKEVIISYAPRFKGKEGEQNFRPVTVKGTPETLNVQWEASIKDIALKQRMLAGDTLKKRQEELDKAVTKSTHSPATAKPSSTTTSAQPPESEAPLFGKKQEQKEMKGEASDKDAPPSSENNEEEEF